MVNSKVVTQLPKALHKLSDDQGANAAVAVILKPTKTDYEILLVKRAENPKDTWSGQTALPGGKRSGEDPNLQATVMRETREETGINLENSQFLGTLPPVQSHPRRDLIILPFVALFKQEPEIRLSKEELSAYAWIPIERIAASNGTAEIRGSKVPAFMLENMLVWGITHRILTELLQAMSQVT